MNIQLSQYPFLRITIPFITGIALMLSGCHYIIIIALTVLSLAYLICYRLIKSPDTKYKVNKYYPASLFLIILAIGWLNGIEHQPKTIDNKFLNKPVPITLKITELKHSNVTVNATAETVIGNNRHKLSIIFQGNDYNLNVGNIIRCQTILEEIRPSVVPYSYDNTLRAKSQGIIYRGFVPAGKYLIIGQDNDLNTAANNIRRTIIGIIFQCGFSDSTANFLITILTGDNSFLDEDTRAAYSQAGIAHILAVSGLHISIISLTIAYLFAFLDRFKLRWLRLLLTLLSVWAFCFITGMSPSAIRASIMTSFVIISIISLKKHSILNALAASAVLTLIFEPFAITDPGFQLSYLSVIGIVLFSDLFTFGERFSLKKKITGLVAVSISAQLGTGLISIMYFNLFPITFLFTNIIIIPLLPLFIITAITAVFLTGIGVKLLFLNNCVDIFYKVFEFTSNLFSGTGSATISDIWLTPVASACFTAALIALGIWLRKRELRGMIYAATVLLITGFAESVYQKATVPERGYFVSDEYESTNIVYFNNRELYLINSKNDTANMSKFLQRHRSMLYRLDIKQTHLLTSATKHKDFEFHYPFTIIGGETFLFAEGNYKHATPRNLHITNAIITNNFYGKIQDLTRVYKIDNIILTKEIYRDKREEYYQELASRKQDYIDMNNNEKVERLY